MKIFSIITAACVQFAAIGMGIVEVRPVYTEADRFFVRRPDDVNHKLLKFKVKIDDGSIRKENGNLVFYVNLINIEVDGDDPVNPANIKIENDGSQNLNVKYSHSGTWESDPIKIVIPGERLQNTPFKFDAANQLKVRINGKETFINSMVFDVTPALSISIPDDERNIRFGKIVYDNGLVTSTRKSVFHLNYKCLAKAGLTVSSDSDFELKNKNGDGLPIRLSLLIDGNKERVSSENFRFSIPADSDNFGNSIEGKCSIKFRTDRCPTAGAYKTIVTFVIQPEG